MTTGFESRPRIGDEIVTKAHRFVVVDVKTAKRVVSEAKNKDVAVARLRAAMGENWQDLYWMALLKEKVTETVLWMDVLEMAKYEGKVESFHKEL